MKTRPLSYPLPLLLFGLALLVLLAQLRMLPANVSAQQQCPAVPPLGRSVWRPGAIINVIFDGNANWSNTEIAAGKRAFDNFSHARIENNTGVQFTGFQRGSSPNIATDLDFGFVTKGLITGARHAPHPGIPTVANGRHSP